MTTKIKPQNKPNLNEWLETTFGDELAPNQSKKSENFTNWFKSSHVLNEDATPRVVFHGTSNIRSILEKGFSYDFAGLGNDEKGQGWYFTSRSETAEGYHAPRKETELLDLSRENAPGTVDVFLSLQNPIHTNDNQSWLEQLPKLGLKAAKQMILGAPNIEDPDEALSNWGDVRREGFERIVGKAARIYADNSYATIFNDFYDGKCEAFLRTLHKVTGHDGVIHKFERGETHYVAWLPEAIKSATLNNGLFDPNCTDITDTRSPAINLELERAKEAKAVVETLSSTGLKRTAGR